jgi:hypothetical protein
MRYLTTQLITFIPSISIVIESWGMILARNNFNETGKRFSQAQQIIIQLYNCNKMLIFFTTWFNYLLSHIQVCFKRKTIYIGGCIV